MLELLAEIFIISKTEGSVPSNPHSGNVRGVAEKPTPPEPSRTAQWINEAGQTFLVEVLFFISEALLKNLS